MSTTTNPHPGSLKHSGHRSRMKEEPAVSNREMEDCDSVASGSSSVESCAADQDMSSGKARDDEVQQELQSSLGKNEARYVLLSRLSVFFVLLFTGALASALVYKLLTDEEQRSFEESFASNSHQLVVAFHQAVERKLVAVDGLATTITGYVLSHEGMSFPNVTLPDFAIKAANARIGADSSLINWMPLVSDEERAGWEAYSNENMDQLPIQLAAEEKLRAEQDERLGLAVDIQADGERPPNRKLQNSTEFTKIFAFDETDGSKLSLPEGSGPHAVYWQSSPALPIPSLNHDMMSLSHVGRHLRAVITHQKAVLGEASDLAKNVQGAPTNIIMELATRLGQYRHKLDEYHYDPVSSMVYPVFDSFDTSSRNVAGLILVNLFWKIYFKEVLPDVARGYIVILKNTAKQVFSYRVDGAEVTYLGMGDKHSPWYGDMGVDTDVGKFASDRSRDIATQSFTSVQLDDEYLQYNLVVYPSEDTEAEFLTSKPKWYTAVIAGIFSFAAVVFVAYDCLVTRRQRIVMAQAIASGNIVTSLFPKQIRNQLYDEQQKQQTLKGKQKAPAAELEAGATPRISLSSSSLMPTNVTPKVRPIADLYQNTTVMFADLSGFTKWSANRSPTDVFELLESIYAGMDRLARKRDVFKVETIGDCYVAVTGIPLPQSDHSVRMVRFARDCLTTTSRLLEELSCTTLVGEDTRNLQLRIGMHSGPTTAGVLRGDKGRFQLFGDTVNTAARMESNGVTGRIHCSAETAKELTENHGLGSWVTPRETVITAKGKGQMQTYFVVAHQTKSSAANSTNGMSIGSAA